MDRARRAVIGKARKLRLTEIINGLELPQTGLHKIRIVYGEEVISTEIKPYQIRPVRSLKVMPADKVDYGHKFSDRSAINQLFAERGEHDDIIMTKHGYVMDTSYANLALFDGRHWYTPAYPMLRGVRREHLLKNGTIRTAILRDRDLGNFKKARLLNAMIEWGEGEDIEVITV